MTYASGCYLCRGCGKSLTPLDEIREVEQTHPDADVHWLAAAGLAMSLLWIAGAGSIIGIVFGNVAAAEIRRRPDKHAGASMALAAQVIGWIGAVAALLPLINAFTADPDLGY